MSEESRATTKKVQVALLDPGETVDVMIRKPGSMGFHRLFGKLPIFEEVRDESKRIIQAHSETEEEINRMYQLVIRYTHVVPKEDGDARRWVMKFPEDCDDAKEVSLDRLDLKGLVELSHEVADFGGFYKKDREEVGNSSATSKD